MAKKAPDLTGQRFGKLVAVSIVGRNKFRRVVWLWKCDCGNEIERPVANIVNGYTSSCGCGRTNELTGKKFGRLLAIERRGHNKHGVILWLWRCDCGKEIERPFEPIRQGRVVSCGCYHREMARTNAIHGQWQQRTYRAWLAMKGRVKGKDEVCRKNYLERGITVCEEWKNDFMAFWRDMGDCPPGLSLDRIDNDGNYEPGNCRWTDQHTQVCNTRRTIRVEVGGEIMALKEACAKLGVNYDCVRGRVRSGIDPQTALYEGRDPNAHKYGNKFRLGNVTPENVRQKISAKLKGKPRSQESIDKQRSTYAAKRAERTSTMTVKELELAGIRLYGKRWKTPLARKIGCSVTTLWKYIWDEEVPEHIATIVSSLSDEQRRIEKT
jgi:hypothetical protein